MYLHKSYFQNFFLLILLASTIFKASNSNFLIQIFFIAFLILFLLCLNNKNLFAELKRNYRVYKYFFYTFIIFLSYVGLQIIPFPIEWMENLAESLLGRRYPTLSLDTHILDEPICEDDVSEFFCIDIRPAGVRPGPGSDNRWT